MVHARAKSRRKCIGRKSKGVNKSRDAKLFSIGRVEARMRRDVATLERLRKEHKLQKEAVRETPSLRKRTQVSETAGQTLSSG